MPNEAMPDDAVSNERMTIDDSVDRLIADWARVEPDLDVGVLGVVHRLRLVRTHFDRALTDYHAGYGLTPTGFGVLSILIRRDDPDAISQRALAEMLHLTPGTVSVRIDRLEEHGLVRRLADPDDSRVTLVELTEEGRGRFMEAAPGHLALHDRLLAPLDADQRLAVADLLRELLVSFEHPTSPVIAGMELYSAVETAAMRRRVGLEDRPGLLVRTVATGSAAGQAGVEEGDLIVAVDGRPARAIGRIAAALGRGQPVELSVDRAGRMRRLTVG